MKNELDTTDIRILELLQENSKMTAKQIGERLNLSQTPIFERIKKLEREGYIKNYMAVLNERKLGLKQTVFIGITLKGHTRSYLEKFLKKVSDFPEVLECYQVAGNYDFILKVILEDIEGYQVFVETKLSLISELNTVNSYIAIKKGKQTNRLDLGFLKDSVK
ncbi:Lrp/AsnC family transcriptional regulator [Pricia antarctica]|uniref:Lrp/AsnC family transcriptional regulator n=1 Tax=Pricia antarctica TaxID=641691 RepID=A0A1G7DIP3_9FLAO|nr:Lrp/AsnC family transcriptional regulator [Pricia antarctica]SDE51447.1 Lrp/AsnC family transcriptional regulator [Pricia antarctica]